MVVIFYWFDEWVFFLWYWIQNLTRKERFNKHRSTAGNAFLMFKIPQNIFLSVEDLGGGLGADAFFPLRDSTRCWPKAPLFCFDISIFDLKIFLKAPFAPNYTNFEEGGGGFDTPFSQFNFIMYPDPINVSNSSQDMRVFFFLVTKQTSSFNFV